MARMSKLLSQTAVYMIGLALSRGIAIALVPFYTRALAPSEFFTWDLCTTTILFVLAVAEAGIPDPAERAALQQPSARTTARAGTAGRVLHGVFVARRRRRRRHYLFRRRSRMGR